MRRGIPLGSRVGLGQLVTQIFLHHATPLQAILVIYRRWRAPRRIVFADPTFHAIVVFDGGMSLEFANFVKFHAASPCQPLPGLNRVARSSSCRDKILQVRYFRCALRSGELRGYPDTGVH